MNRRAKQVLIITLLATAICTDRALAVAPAFRPVVGQMARTITGRLTTCFVRILPAVRLQQVRRDEQVRMAAVVISRTPFVSIQTQSGFSAFQFRLPPPVV